MNTLAFQTFEHLHEKSRKDRDILVQTEDHIMDCFQRRFTRYYLYDDGSILSIYSSSQIYRATIIIKKSYLIASRKKGVVWLMKNGMKIDEKEVN